MHKALKEVRPRGRSLEEVAAIGSARAGAIGLYGGYKTKLDEQQKGADARSVDLDRLQASLRPREQHAEEKERALPSSSSNWTRGEDQLRQGLVQEEGSPCSDQSSDQLAALRDERDKLQLSMEAEREQLMEAARRDAARIVEEGLSHKAHWEQRVAEIAARDAELEKAQSLVTEREKRLQARRQSLASEVQARVDEALAHGHADNERIKTQLDQAYGEVQRLETELNSLREAQRRSGGDPARLADDPRQARRTANLKNMDAGSGFA